MPAIEGWASEGPAAVTLADCPELRALAVESDSLGELDLTGFPIMSTLSIRCCALLRLCLVDCSALTPHGIVPPPSNLDRLTPRGITAPPQSTFCY